MAPMTMKSISHNVSPLKNVLLPPLAGAGAETERQKAGTTRQRE